jgi:hypothetical protein
MKGIIGQFFKLSLTLSHGEQAFFVSQKFCLTAQVYAKLCLLLLMIYIEK